MRLYYFTNAEHVLQNVAKRRVKITPIKDLIDPFEFLPLRLPDKGSRIGEEGGRQKPTAPVYMPFKQQTR